MTTLTRLVITLAMAISGEALLDQPGIIPHSFGLILIFYAGVVWSAELK